MRRKHKNEAEAAEVDLTPMLDVTFILLIFFIVTSVFLKEEGLDLTPPPPSNSDAPPNTVPVIQVLIDEENFIYVNNRITDLGGVRAQIERLHAESPQSAVLVQAHPRSKSGIAVAIIDKARVAEVPVSFVLSDVN